MHTYNRASKFGKEELIKLKGKTGNPTAAARCFRTPDGMMESSLHRTLSRGVLSQRPASLSYRYALLQAQCAQGPSVVFNIPRALSPKACLTNFKINKMGVFNNYNEVKKSPERND